MGDHRQLGAVGPGGLFRLLVADTAAAELTDARRFVEPWEAAATLRLRQGDPTVVDDYERHGRLVGGSREEMVEAAFASWQRCRELGESVVVLAHDHGTVDAPGEYHHPPRRPPPCPSTSSYQRARRSTSVTVRAV